MLLANGVSIPTIAGAVEEEEEYARSEANSAHYDGYVTDHTDLASEIDESEYRRELLNDVSPEIMRSVNSPCQQLAINYFKKLSFSSIRMLRNKNS